MHSGAGVVLVLKGKNKLGKLTDAPYCGEGREGGREGGREAVREGGVCDYCIHERTEGRSEGGREGGQEKKDVPCNPILPRSRDK